jgi:hypothetical protein
MRHASTFSTAGHEVGGIVVLVAADRAAGRALSATTSKAVVRSAVPLASVKRASTMRPLRFSIIRCPM